MVVDHMLEGTPLVPYVFISIDSHQKSIFPCSLMFLYPTFIIMCVLEFHCSSFLCRFFRFTRHQYRSIDSKIKKKKKYLFL